MLCNLMDAIPLLLTAAYHSTSTELYVFESSIRYQNADWIVQRRFCFARPKQNIVCIQLFDRIIAFYNIGIARKLSYLTYA